MATSDNRRKMRQFYNMSYFNVPRLIDIEKVIVDESFQRKLNRTHLNKMIREFDPNINQPIAVAKNEDGTFSVLDGQHRVELMKAQGAAQILAFVFTAKDVEEQAKVFLDINTSQMKPTKTDQFKARIAANDPIAIGVEKILKRNGFFITGAKGKGFTSANIAESMYRAGVLDTTLKLVNIVFPTEMRQVNLDAGLIAGMGLFRGQLERAHVDRLIEVLSMRSPADVHRQAHMMDLSSRGAVAAYNLFRALVRLHNEGAGRNSGINKLNRNNSLFIQDDSVFKQKFWEAEIYG